MLFAIAAYGIVLSLVLASAVVANVTTARKRNVNASLKVRASYLTRRPLNFRSAPACSTVFAEDLESVKLKKSPCVLQDKVNGQHDTESEKLLNGKKPEVVNVDSKPPTRPFVLYAIVFLILFGAAAAVIFFTMSESTPIHHPPIVHS